MKLITLIASLLFTVSATAQDITILVNGSPGGTFFVRSELYAKGLADAGYTVNTVNIPKNKAAAEKFKETDAPTMMVWMDALAPVRPVEATIGNFVSLEYTAPLFLCAITGKESGNIGAPKMYVMDPVLEMVPGSKIIPYKNTGATLNAGLAGEVDFAYLNQGKAKKLKDAGYPCRAVQGVAQHAVVVAKNINVSELRTTIKRIQQDVEFVAWLDKNGFNSVTELSHETELNTVLNSQDQWKQAAN